MAIDREFGPALLKAVRSLEPRGRGWLWEDPAWRLGERAPVDLGVFLAPSDTRLWRMVGLLRHGWADAATISAADRHRAVVHRTDRGGGGAEHRLVGMPLEEAKRHGFGDAEVAAVSGVPPAAVRRARVRAGLAPAYRRVDTCAGEFPAETPYFYSSYAESEVPPPADRRSVIVVGSGPIRIGQGIEFDYCSVRAAWAIRDLGYDAVVINNNPETVSTDYDACSRLYFEPLDTESVLDVLDHERALTGEPPLVLLTFGGQTAIDLARDLAYADVPGRRPQRRRDRDLRGPRALRRPAGRARAGGTAGQPGQRPRRARGRGRRPRVPGHRPALVGHRRTGDRGRSRPGRPGGLLAGEVGWPLRVDALVAGVELDVDVIADGREWSVPGILEQRDPPGVHSGDSLAVLPPRAISRAAQERAAEAAGRIAVALGVRGIVNVQAIVAGERVVVIEANPRASRTVPIVAKATGRDVVAAAVRCALGATLAEAGLTPGLAADGPMVAVKAPIDSLWRLPGVATELGPEMRSTGEVLGWAWTTKAPCEPLKRRWPPTDRSRAGVDSAPPALARRLAPASPSADAGNRRRTRQRRRPGRTGPPEPRLPPRRSRRVTPRRTGW